MARKQLGHALHLVDYQGVRLVGDELLRVRLGSRKRGRVVEAHVASGVGSLGDDSRERAFPALTRALEEYRGGVGERLHDPRFDVSPDHHCG